LEFSIPLNKFEKHELILKLLSEGKTYRDICHIAHVNPRCIKPIAKEYERKKRLETKKDENKSCNTKRRSKNCLAYELFLKGRTTVQVSIDLNLDFQQVRTYWTEFLQLQNMKKLYNIFMENEFHLDSLFRIYYFMKRNKIPIKDMENILRVVDDSTKLYQIHSNLKAEIEKLKQIKNNIQHSQYNQFAPLKPLPKLTCWNYQYSNNLL
jgi:hypothetical protein